MLFPRNRFSFLGLIVCLLSSGCSSEVPGPTWPEPVTVFGKVTRQGKPLTKVQVMFVPDDKTLGTGGGGQTDETGEYQVQTRWSNQKLRDGLIPGRYKVAFSRFVKPDGSVWTPAPDSTEGPASVGAREEMPFELSNPAMSKFVIEIASGKSNYDLDIP